LCSQGPEEDPLVTEFEAVAAALDAVLKDLDWRKPDVEEEEAKLAELRKAAKENPGVDVASQEIVVRVLLGVLEDKMAEANRLSDRLEDLKDAIKAREAQKPAPSRRGRRGQALR